MDIGPFCDEYQHTVECLPGVTSVEFIGSIVTGGFVPGSSDFDCFVHSVSIPKKTKRLAITLVRQLNAKYGLGLERVPYQHPTPFFIDSHIKRLLYRLLKGRWELRWLRATVKRIAPSHGLVWRLQRGEK